MEELKFNGKTCSFPEDAKPQVVDPTTGTKLFFTYEVEWEESSISWASRWDTYLAMTDADIHWFSIVNSIVVVFFLSGECYDSDIYLLYIMEDITFRNLNNDND